MRIKGTEKATAKTTRDFWSVASPAEATIAAAAGTLTITPTVVIPSGAHGIPSGATIDCVHLLLKWRQTEDSSGSDNAINSATMAVQVDDSGDTGWLTGYLFADNSYLVDVSVSAIVSGDLVEGITDIKSRVDGADTYDIQIINACADGNNLIFRDFQWGLRVLWR